MRPARSSPGMNPVEIRPARPGDLPAVLSLLGQPDMDDGQTVSETEARALFRQIEETPGHRVFVAETDGAVVGTFALLVVQHLSHRGARSAVIEDVVVRADRQGRGVGREMMRVAAERARSAGCYKMSLSSGLARDAVHRFYEALGFERHGVSFRLALGPAP